MSEPKHTPGPWRTTSLNGWDAVKPIGSNLPICKLVENNPANAYLIAAAPDLFAACVAMLAAHDGDIEDLVAAHTRMEVAVAKARGGDR